VSKKSQPKPPQAPDPREIAQTDAEFNRIDQYTPYGSLTYGGPSRNQATLSLSPEYQNLFNMQTQSDTNLLGSALQAQGGIDQLIQNPLNTQGLPGLPQNFDAYRSDTERAFYDRSAGLLNEQFGRDEENLRQTLANQGLQSGGQAFGQEFGQFNQRRGETFSNLARDAVLYGGQEASRSLAGQSGLRSQLLGERGSMRSNQFNELASLLGLQQVQQPGLQNFFAPGQAGVMDAYGLQQSALQNNFNAMSGRNASAKGAGAGLAGTLGSAFIGKGK
jgi:hypothetical protein